MDYIEALKEFTGFNLPPSVEMKIREMGVFEESLTASEIAELTTLRATAMQQRTEQQAAANRGKTKRGLLWEAMQAS